MVLGKGIGIIGPIQISKKVAFMAHPNVYKSKLPLTMKRD